MASPPKGPRSLMAARARSSTAVQELRQSLSNPSSSVSSSSPSKAALALPSALSSSLGVPSPQLARSASADGEAPLSLLERLRALRESATAEPLSNSGQQDELARAQPSPTLSSSSGRTLMFPTPLAQLLSQVTQAQTRQPATSTNISSEQRPPPPLSSSLLASTSKGVTQSTAQQPPQGSTSASLPTRTASSFVAGYRGDQDDRSRRPVDDRPGGRDPLGDPRDHNRKRVYSTSSSIRDRNRDDYERPPYTDDHRRTGRDDRPPLGAARGRSPDWRREDEERRRYDSRGPLQDPRDEGHWDRDSRAFQEQRDVRERGRRREESPRRGGTYDRAGDSHGDRRRSSSPPPALVPQSPEFFVRPSRQALGHPFRRPAVDPALTYRTSPPPPPPQAPGLYTRGGDPSFGRPEAYSPRMDGRPLDRIPTVASSYPPRAYPDAMNQQQIYSPPSSSSTSYIPTNKRPREMSSEYPPTPSASALPESGNGQRRTFNNKDPRYGLASSMPGHEAGPVELDLEAGGRSSDPVAERENADSKRRKLPDRAQEEKAADLASLSSPLAQLPPMDLLSSSNGHSGDLLRPESGHRRRSLTRDSDAPLPPPVGRGGSSLLSRILPLELDQPLGNSRPSSSAFKKPYSWRSRPCKQFVEGKKCPTADNCLFRHAPPDDDGCKYFQAYTLGRHDKPCQNGDRCRRSHSMSSPCVYYHSAEGCVSKTKCKFRHTNYATPPVDILHQPQAYEIRRSDGAPSSQRASSPSLPARSRLESYPRGPIPKETPPVVDHRFGPLIEALSDGKSELCSKAASRVLAIDKKAYAKAGMANWSQFLGFAQAEGIVDLGRGDVPGREWVKLTSFGMRGRKGVLVPSRRSESGGSTQMDVDGGFGFDDLISELGLPPPTEDLSIVTQAAPSASSSSSPTKSAPSLPPSIPPPPPPASPALASGSTGDEVAALRRQVKSLTQSLELAQEDLEFEKRKTKREETRANEAEERAEKMEKRWRAELEKQA